MATSNPFAMYQLAIPSKYEDQVKKYSRTSGQKNDSIEFSPCDRQVDVWYLAFLLAVNEGLEPIREKETYNATAASIFDRDPERVSFIQLSVLGLTGDVDSLKDPKSTFDYALGLANAGFPKLFQILGDEDDRPLWAILDAFESMSSAA